MTITLHWWNLSILLFVFPLIYLVFRKHEGDFDLYFDWYLITGICWSACFVLTVVKFFSFG